MSQTSLLLRYWRGAIPMWVGTIFVVAGSIGAYGSLLEWRDARRFEREAETAQAEVVGTSIERATRDGNERTRYLVTYRFVPAGGPPIERTEEISIEEWEALAAGSVLPVRYLPSEPAGARARSDRSAWEPPLLVAVTIVFALVGAAIALPWWRRALVLWRVQRSGITTEGTVLEVNDTGTRVNRIPQWQVKYEYRDGRGELRQGKSDYLSADEALAWQPGQRALIRFDRDRPTDSVWLGSR